MLSRKLLRCQTQLREFGEHTGGIQSDTGKRGEVLFRQEDLGPNSPKQMLCTCVEVGVVIIVSSPWTQLPQRRVK